MTFDFQGTRALVIDDYVQQAQPVFDALKRLRIASIFMEGKVEDLEGPRLQNVRIAFVDMDLIGGDDPDQIAEYTADFLASVLEDTPELLAIFTWTTNADIVENFRARYRSKIQNIVPLFLEMEAKPLEEMPADDLAEKILTKVVDAINTQLGVRLLWGWEEAANRSVIDTTSTLIEIVRQQDAIQTEQVSEAVSEILVALGHSAREYPTDTLQEAVSSIYSALNPILLDHLEARIANPTLAAGLNDGEVEERIKIFQEAVSDHQKAKSAKDQANRATDFINSHADVDLIDWILNKQLSAPLQNAKQKKARLRSVFDPQNVAIPGRFRGDQLSRLNRMVHISRDNSTPPRALPGNVYFFCDDGRCTPVGRGPVDFSIEEAFGAGHKEIVNSVIRKENRDAYAFMADVSPACDFAQGKVKMSRVMCGCLIPVADADRIPGQTDYLYTQSGLIRLDENEVEGISAGTYSMVLNAHFQTGIPIQKISELKPAFRIRQGTLVDIQAWLARHGNRPGIVTVVR